MSVPRSRAATQLLPRYVEHRVRDVATLHRAIDEKDFQAVSRMGHNLRGNGSSYGFPEIAAVGEALEAAARAKNVAGVLEQLKILEEWLVENRSASLTASSLPARPASGTRVRAASDSGPSGRDEDDD